MYFLEARPYQLEAIQAVKKSFTTGNNFTLLKAPTGAGKSYMMAEIVKWAVDAHKIKVLVLAHRGILIDQLLATLKRVGIDARDGRESIDGDVVVVTIQTMARRALSTFNLVIIDECHKISDRETDSQYKRVIDELLEKNHRLRVLGLTATPFRLNDGYIYGHENDWFDDLCYDIELNELIGQGYLVPMKYFVDSGIDFKGIKKTAGEYNEKELGDLMKKEMHLESVKHTILEKAKGRSHIAVFCVTIEHAELMAETLQGFVIHSRMSKEDREMTLSLFHWLGGSLCSVGTLSEGWDEPRCDCVVLARPTLSPALYVQMCGRSLRNHLSQSAIYNKYLAVRGESLS